jgi:hypothetical protein
MSYDGSLPSLADPFAPADGADTTLPASGPEIRDPPPKGTPD